MQILIKRMAVALGLVGLGLTSPLLAQTPDPVGNWHGALNGPRGPLPLILTIGRADDGSLKAELESPNQAPGQKIPASEVTTSDMQLTFRIPTIGASYKGNWVPAEQAWDGVFSQGAEMPLKLIKGLPPAKPVIEGLDGSWQGKITLNGTDLRFILRVQTTERGTIAAADSPDQLARGMTVDELTRDGQKVEFRMSRIGADYVGTLSEDGTSISGTFSQGGATFPLTLAHSDAPAQTEAPKRPQTPQPPFPYTAEEVSFDNPAASDVHLAGTLTLPEGKGPFPAAILITGSGQQDRDETIMGHKPFAVIADYLTRRGIAVLRVDDRGVGSSKGPVAQATSADFATDSNAAFAYLRTRTDIRADAIGFIGHSEGGMIGPIAMASNPDVAFLVMLAGPGTALDKLMLSQRRLVGASMGQSEEAMDRAEPVMASLFHAIAQASSYEDGRKAAEALLTPEAMVALGAPPDTEKAVVLGQITNPWFYYFLRYQPSLNLSRIRVPVLALNGSLDRQVPAKDNLAAIKAALAKNPDATTEEMPGLNHLFQDAKTGAIAEYAEIEETMSPAVLERIAGWINARFGRK